MLKSNAENNDVFMVLKTTFTNFIPVFILICSNHLYCMGTLGNLTDVISVSQHVAHFVQRFYEVHDLSDQTDNIELYVSHDKRMISEESYCDNNRDERADNWLICLGHRDDQKAIFISPYLNALLESSHMYESDSTILLGTYNLVVFELLNILDPKHYEVVPNTKRGREQLRDQAKKNFYEHIRMHDNK